MIRPLCFMVMPYGRKSTQAEAGAGPGEIDFNALWDRAYVPVITELGYEPVRADQDTGALIITQMLERLYFADLVLADLTIPNGNVYYEIGIRHAARRTGCVLLAADWSRQLFDITQMRTVRYPMPEGAVTEATAIAIRQAIRGAIPSLARGISPMHVSISGYPQSVDESAASTMKDQMAQLAAFQAQVRAVRAVPRLDRMGRARKLVDDQMGKLMTAAVAIALLLMLRDCADSAEDWNVVLGFADGMSDDLKSLPEIMEQRALALSNAGWHVEAIAALETLVATFGPTPERLGLLGGRYKRLARDAKEPEDRKQALTQSIKHYERGMELDLNDYYCSGNLPSLYRKRNNRGDEDRAQAVLRVVIAACERARNRGTADAWLRPTLLVAAFDAGDADKAEQLSDEVESEGAVRWKLRAVLDTLELSLPYSKDDVVRARLSGLVGRLRPLVGT